MSASWEALRDLFDGALERPIHERAAYLSERTQGNEGLRREIESLLAAHGDADRFLSAPAFRPSSELSSETVAMTSGASTRLTAGTRLGPFEILALLGNGGMGEVYRARDTRLDRFVAIKILSAEVATAPRGRQRFEREARAISKLSHPRICTMHDIGVAAHEGRDVAYLVMELLDGETLAARIARGPLSIDQSLAYAIDIADALIAAHGQGIVHRDLKPANVMVTSTGVKLLDFGLAQLRTQHGLAVASSAEAPLSSAGLVFGTLPYMSPEQVRGELVDTRTDVFALGVLLHEMLTGRRPFAADSQADTVAAILEHQAPAVSDLQPLASSGLDRVVRKCLAKDPDDRWQTARDLKSELIWVREERGVSGRGRTPLPATSHRRRWQQVLVTGIPTIAAVLLAVMLWRTAAPPVRRVTPLALNLPPGVTLAIPVNGTSFVIAPDGSRIAFLGVRDGRQSLFIHTLETGQTQDVRDTRDAVHPTFSPDSQWVAFAHGTMGVRKVLAAGGPIQLVWRGAARQLTWLADGRIVFATGNRPLREIGDADKAITTQEKDEDGHSTPLVMRDGSLLFTVRRGGSLSSVAVSPSHGTEAGKTRELVANATTPRLLDEAIVFARGRSLMAAGLDSRAIRLSSEARALDLQVQTTRWGAPMYALSNNGTLVYARPAAGRRLVWMDRSGQEAYVKTDERTFTHLRLSPDGTRIVAGGDEGRLWIFSADGALAYRLTSGPAGDSMPVWSPDGSTIFFTTGGRKISVIPADRSKPARILFEVPSPQRLHATSITPDGKRLLTHWDLMPKEVDLRLLELGPPAVLTLLMGDSHTETDGQVSPDGRWLAYQSAESTHGDEGQIVVSRFPDVRAERRVISEGLGRHPIWSRDGRTLYYRTQDGAVMSAAITTGPSFTRDLPVRVVKPASTLQDLCCGQTYDVSPDGQRFLFIKAPDNDIRSLEVVLNFDVKVKEVLAGRRP